ncbi:MAG: pilus assembly protein TadG-related protein [Hyphomonadaceae bacterium]
MMWALMGAILVGLVGLSVDFARAQALRAQLQNAADGAALVAERSSNESIAERTEAARAFFEAEMSDRPMDGLSFVVEQMPDGGHRVSASVNMPVGLAGIVQNRDWRIGVSSEAQSEASPPIEVALVLDNTYSMAHDIGALRGAANDLVDMLLGLDGDAVSVGLVPFETMVNIGNQSSHLAWMDTTGEAPYNGELLEDRLITREYTNNRRNNGDCNHLDTEVGNSPYEIVWVHSGRYCYGYNPSDINYFRLFDATPNVAWGGCVEARPEPYDVMDTPPVVGNPSTRWVPFFWIDDSDTTGGVLNDWLDDRTLPPGTLQDGGRTLSVFKYDGSNGSIDNSPPFTSGPNRGCPTPIVPLTTSRATIRSAINDMEVISGGGTNSAVGLAWGWRVLSPGAPFTQGRDPNVEDVRKVIVLMTDGENTNMNATSEDDLLESPYNAYGFRGQWTNFAADMPAQYRRSISDSESSYVSYVNSRMRELCDNLKDDDVEIYTIVFRDPSRSIRDLLRTCATDADHAFTADNASELQQAFRVIGTGIGKLRLTR